jgi:hypothetical protein
MEQTISSWQKVLLKWNLPRYRVPHPRTLTTVRGPNLTTYSSNKQMTQTCNCSVKIMTMNTSRRQRIMIGTLTK